jgi:serine/threonine protein kinase
MRFEETSHTPFEVMSEPQLKWGTWNDYLLDKTLGKGSESHVKLAFHRVTHQPVAIKVLKKHHHVLTTSSRVVDSGTEESNDTCQLPHELEIHRQLQHPHVVTLLEVLRRNKEVWVVLEYCSKGSIMSQLAVHELRPFTVSEAHTLFCQMLFGVAYLHSRGISHRDLKPENLLINAGGMVKLCDFGVSASINGGPLSGLYGTHPYMAPEILTCNNNSADSGYDGEAIDLWSCGVILLVLLLGRPMWLLADAEKDVMFKEFLERGLERFQFEARLKDVLLTMLIVDPKKRWSAQQILKHEWCTTLCLDHSRYLHYHLSKSKRQRWLTLWSTLSFRKRKTKTTSLSEQTKSVDWKENERKLDQ